MKILDVTKFGIRPNSDELLTKKLQSLIDNAKKGSVIYFPRGRYVLSTIYLKSDLTIKLSKFATILGSNNFYDFDKSEIYDFPIYQDASHTYFRPSLFVGLNIKNVTFTGKGTIDMQSTWDEDNIRDIVHRGAKCIALKECNNVLIEGLKINNVTDLAVYFAGCNNVVVRNLDLKVYIDGISPDNSKNVLIENCKVLSGDDAIVFKSSYNLNRLDYCKDIVVRNCQLSSRCNCIKFGTETNGGFYNIDISNITMKNTRISGIAIESVDGAIIDGIKINNVTMSNVNNPIFIHLGKRLRGPIGSKIGQIKNVLIENVTAKGPYRKYKSIAWNYVSYKNNDFVQDPFLFGGADGVNFNKKDINWQFTSNVCGLIDHYLENITLRNIDLNLYGGVISYNKEVSENAQDYPEAYVYGRVLPASGFFFRHIKNLKLENVNVKCSKKDVREKIICIDVK